MRRFRVSRRINRSILDGVASRAQGQRHDSAVSGVPLPIFVTVNSIFDPLHRAQTVCRRERYRNRSRVGVPLLLIPGWRLGNLYG